MTTRTSLLKQAVKDRILARFHQALAYRADPTIAGILGTTAEEPDPHLKVLREQGWEAFRASRDANYTDSQ